MRNALGSAASLYLRQHAQQSVHWCEWSPEVLERAAAEGKWLLVSIGYSTCHWCHVMAHEVFDDPEVAAVLNERWISIKVDREERPDLDQAYMAACLAMTGQGGWPLNAICLPDGRPVWAATYLPKERFLAALHELALVKNRHGLQAEDYAAQVAEAVQGTEPEEATDVDIPTAVRTEVAASWDLYWGGFRGAPKFPLPSTWVASVRWASLQDWPEASAHAERTVASLLRSGTYDLLRGGLFRYSTDGAWVVPHFEKMLYDSAQFASLCALVGSPIALEGMRETLAFMERDLAKTACLPRPLMPTTPREKGGTIRGPKQNLTRSWERVQAKNAACGRRCSSAKAACTKGLGSSRPGPPTRTTREAFPDSPPSGRLP
jgi:uncharacterized protein